MKDWKAPAFRAIARSLCRRNREHACYVFDVVLTDERERNEYFPSMGPDDLPSTSAPQTWKVWRLSVCCACTHVCSEKKPTVEEWKRIDQDLDVVRSWALDCALSDFFMEALDSAIEIAAGHAESVARPTEWNRPRV